MSAPALSASGAGGAVLLQPQRDGALAERMALSAAAAEGAVLRTGDVETWLARRRDAHGFRVDRIPFDRLDGWSFDGTTGDLRHRSGRFFTVEGLRVRVGEDPVREWHQPIIRQPEVGILGIVAQEFDGVLHFLMQAKMEPGNSNLLQLSPTVQATRSNYTKAHEGAGVRYVEYFTEPGRGRVLADALQSEHGAWFLRKSNRNMLVEAIGEVPVADDFCWLTLGQIGALLRRDNIVNMDARTVLACASFAGGDAPALHSETELLSWFTAERSRHQVTVTSLPLGGLPGWVQGGDAIRHEEGRYFDVVAVEVEAGSREVGRWTQPLIAPRGTGVTAFLVRYFGGVPHLLVHARVEGGFLDTVELAPTVQYTPANYAHVTGAGRPPFLDAVLAAGPSRIRYEALHSEEGGRFLHAESRYLFVEADEAVAPLDPPPGYRWATPAQLTGLLRHNHYLNVQARTLLSCLATGAVRL